MLIFHRKMSEKKQKKAELPQKFRFSDRLSAWKRNNTTHGSGRKTALARQPGHTVNLLEAAVFLLQLTVNPLCLTINLLSLWIKNDAILCFHPLYIYKYIKYKISKIKNETKIKYQSARVGGNRRFRNATRRRYNIFTVMNDDKTKGWIITKLRSLIFAPLRFTILTYHCTVHRGKNRVVMLLCAEFHAEAYNAGTYHGNRARRRGIWQHLKHRKRRWTISAAIWS